MLCKGNQGIGRKRTEVVVVQDTGRRARRSGVVVTRAAVWRVGWVGRQASLARTPAADDRSGGVNVRDIGGTVWVKVDGARGSGASACHGDCQGDVETIDEGD